MIYHAVAIKMVMLVCQKVQISHPCPGLTIFHLGSGLRTVSDIYPTSWKYDENIIGISRDYRPIMVDIRSI